MAEMMADPIPVNTESKSAERSAPRRAPFLLIWESLRHPLLLVVVSVFLLALVVAGMALPQLPGQYADDPAGATRWLLTTRNGHGSLGPLLAGLGLFDLIHSPLIRFGLALLGLLLLVHLGEQLADIQRSRRLPTLLGAAKATAGEPLPIPGSGPVERSRQTLDVPFARMATAISNRLGDSFDANPSVLVRRAQISQGAGEMRWLVQGHTWAYYVRPLLLAGILLTLAVLWGGVNFGWEVTPPPLAPGGVFHFPQRALNMRYALLDGDEKPAGGSAAVQVELGDASQVLPVNGSRTARLNNTAIHIEADVPGILLESEGSLNFLLPGRTGTAKRVGFVFPTAGSEESVLIPDADLGVRLVRLAQEGRFLVEVIAGNGETVARQEISAGDQRFVQFPSPLANAATSAAPDIRDVPLTGLLSGSQTGDGGFGMHLRFLPGVTVRVRYLPGDGLLWASLALVLAGAVGYLRRPYFALVQLGPWGEERSVLVVQSSSAEPLTDLEGSGQR